MADISSPGAEGSGEGSGELNASTQTIKSVFTTKPIYKETTSNGCCCEISACNKTGGEGDGSSDHEIADSGFGSEEAAQNQGIEDESTTKDNNGNTECSEKSTTEVSEDEDIKKDNKKIDKYRVDNKCGNWMMKSQEAILNHLPVEVYGVTRIENKAVNSRRAGKVELADKQMSEGDTKSEQSSTLSPNDSRKQRITNYFLTEAHGDTIKMIVPTLTQMHKTMKVMELKMERTQEAVSCVAHGLKGQGVMIQRLDKRMDLLERRDNRSTPSASPSRSPSPSRLNFPASYPRPYNLVGRSASCPKTPLSKSPPFSRATQIRIQARSTSCMPSAVGSNQSNQSHSCFAETFSALGKNLLNEAQEGNVKNVRKLLDSGADANYLGAGRWSPLHRAASKSSGEIIELLLAQGAVVNARNCQGSTPLHIAAENDYSGRCVELLIEADALLDIKNRFGRTALHYAAERGNSRAVFLLVAAGASKSARDDKGKTPMDMTKCISVRRILRVYSRSRRSGYSKVKRRSVSPGGIP